jgi:hypothetical protein
VAALVKVSKLLTLTNGCSKRLEKERFWTGLELRHKFYYTDIFIKNLKTWLMTNEDHLLQTEFNDQGNDDV